MKKKISISVDEEIYQRLMKIWIKEQKKSLSSDEPKPVKLSVIAEKVLGRGLEK
jgi:hypothetical protein